MFARDQMSTESRKNVFTILRNAVRTFSDWPMTNNIKISINRSRLRYFRAPNF